MINLCYLKKQISDQEEFYDQFLSSIFPHVDYSTDLVITSEKIKPRQGIRTFYYEELDLESIYNIPLKNIFLLDFDYISATYIRSLISMKSKKSEIVGLENFSNQNLKNLRIETQLLRNSGYSDDQIKVALILKYNQHTDIVNLVVSYSIPNKLNNMVVKEIDEVEDITKFIKR